MASPLVQLGPCAGQPRGPTAEPDQRDSPPGRGGRGLSQSPARPRPSGNLRGGSALPRAPLARAASGHQPLRRGSLRARGIFLWMVLEASAAARSASPHPPESWRPPSPQRGAPRPPERRAPGPARGPLLTHRRVWTGPALSRCHRPAPALQSEPGSPLPLPRYLLGGAGSASKLRGIWLKIQAPCAGLRLARVRTLRPPARPPASR